MGDYTRAGPRPRPKAPPKNKIFLREKDPTFHVYKDFKVCIFVNRLMKLVCYYCKFFFQ